MASQFGPLQICAVLVGAGALAACASLDGVEAKKPTASDIARIVEVEHACVADTTADGAPASAAVEIPAAAVSCPQDRQPKRVLVRDLSCQRLPLRAGVPEVARSRCSYTAVIEYAAGNVKDLGRVESDFGLHDYAPGAWSPVFQWARTK